MILFYLNMALLFFTVIYISFTLIMSLSIRTKNPSGTMQPDISIIIVAKDEESMIPLCLESLTRLTYPGHKMEWILVNDRSSDKTESIMNRFAKTHKTARVITIDKLPASYSGKCYGLIQGVKASRGDILFFTDADCIVPPSWIQSTLAQYDENTGMVGGYLILDKKGSTAPLFHRLQSLDWINITSVGAAWANLNSPLSLFGNNYSIKKDVYQKAGGFEAIQKHHIEDYALVRNVRSRTDNTIRIRLDIENLVYTHPAGNLIEFYHQRKRWAVGGRSHNVLGLLLMITAFMVHLLIPVTMLTGQWMLGLYIFLGILLWDIFFLSWPLRKLGRIDLLKYMILYELLYFAYSVFFTPFLLFARKVRWKPVDKT